MPPSRRDDLIDAAMRVFGQHGFHRSGLDKVLQEGGISRMTLYNHFKSKDELVVAALRRRDEIFRNRMMKFVESRTQDPIERLLAVFDFQEAWLAEKDFCGCMFLNACAEFEDPQSPIRRVAAEHKQTVLAYLTQLCEQACLKDPKALAEQLDLLIEGAIVTNQAVGQTPNSGISPSDIAQRAKDAAQKLIEAARR